MKNSNHIKLLFTLPSTLLAAEEAVQRAAAIGPKPESKIYAQKAPFYFEKKKAAATAVREQKLLTH